ncbi:MAG: hypothetical protein HRT54_03655 [Colwellia sp.]|nr:hypothetical protein [Colwellia sp.]
MKNEQNRTAELIEYATDEAVKRVATMTHGTLIKSKDTLPDHLLETLVNLKLMRVFGRSLSRAVKIGSINLVEAKELSSDRHNQYIVTHNYGESYAGN